MHGRHSMTPMTTRAAASAGSSNNNKVNNNNNNNNKKKKKTNNLYFMTNLLISFGLLLFSFYLGTYIGWNMEHSSSSSSSSSLSSTSALGGLFTGSVDCDCTSSKVDRSTPVATDFHQSKSNSQQSKVKNKNVNTTTNEIDWEKIANDQQKYIDILMAQHKEERQMKQVVVPRALDRLDELHQHQNQQPLQQQQQPLQQQRPPMLRQQRRNNKRTRYFLPRGEYVNRTDFHNKFSKQLGIPLDENELDNDRVLILYSEPNSYPNPNPNPNPNSNSNSNSNSNISDNNDENNGNIPLNDAIENCNFMHVVLTNQDRHKQCIAIMGQYESYHVHRFMRMQSSSSSLSTTGNTGTDFKPQPINSSLPLRYVPRGMQQNGRITHKIPSDKFQNMYWNDLMEYKSSLYENLVAGKDGMSVMDDLDPILRKVAAYGNNNESNNNNTVIILVCNFGQSELLMNFICNANSKGLSNILNKIILFATDQETHDLATSMGIQSYYSERIFSKMPKEAAKEYADDTFRLMMFAKVYCVHIVSQLGYNFLFQDVDVVWYKNPLDWFHNETNPDYHFDMFFQDDGSRALFYAPYAANTGFYYVRNNERTKYFFHSLLMSGDLIMASYSHQIALNALLSEHVSIYGLSVKICDRNDIEFPGGYWYHERHDLMKQYILSSSSSSSSLSSSSIQQNTSSTSNISNKVSGSLQEPHPYVFHFSWTDNKDNKIRFMEQMGEWYLEETCKSVSRNNILNNTAAATAADHGIMNSSNGTGNSVSSIRQHCCAVTPRMKCHYRDKPSKIPCYDSIPIDENGKSFW